jgi:hypothetical protein
LKTNLAAKPLTGLLQTARLNLIQVNLVLRVQTG